MPGRATLGEAPTDAAVNPGRSPDVFVATMFAAAMSAVGA
jgi:hypothetical protein